MLARIGSFCFWLYIGILCIVMFPIALVIWLLTVLVDRRLVVLHFFTSIWASFFTWLNPQWNVRVTRARKYDSRPRVIVSNHLSLVDIPVAFRIFMHFKWVSKAENFKIPFVGWNMSLNRYIKLHRGSTKSQGQMIKDCERTLASGSSVYIFPEGTRSATGQVTKFRRGAFEIAKRMKVPILPIVIDGSAEALPKKGLVLRGIHRIHVKLLDEIPPESFENESADELSTRVQAIITEEHEKMRAERLAKKS